MNNYKKIHSKQPGATLFAIVLAVLFCFCTGAIAQDMVFEDQVHHPAIKSVEFYNQSKEQSLPLIRLNSAEELVLSFDDLRPGTRSYFYTIEHCDMNWRSSSLSPLDYLDGFQEDRINDYDVAVNTLQAYTHYRLSLPNQSMKPKIDGNYILKVYEEGQPEKLVLTRRFYVLCPAVMIRWEVVASAKVPDRRSNQKVNITVEHPGLSIQNPYTDVKLIVRQNGRRDQEQTVLRPNQVRSGQLVYNDLGTLDFKGSNEFRKFDIRSLRLQTERVERIYKDSVNTVQLLPDEPYTASAYSYSFDENGNFYIRNQEGRDRAVDGDYAYVTFTLEAERPRVQGDVYIAGKFNDYRLSDENKLVYDAQRSRYYGSVYLKQGLYDYQYVWADRNDPAQVDNTLFEGSFFETKNSYQAFFYYRRPESRWDQLVGFQEFKN